MSYKHSHGDCWYVVYTKPRKERVALENLHRQGFKCFLPWASNPRQKLARRPGGRVEPLFPRYLFMTAEGQSIGSVRSTRGVSNLVRFGIKIASVSNEVIDHIRSRINLNTGLVELRPDQFEPGDKIEVFDGPLAGLRGVFHEHRGEIRSILLMKLLGQQSPVQVDTRFIKKAG